MALVIWTLESSSTSPWSWALWSILALALCLEFLAFQSGVVKGMEIYRQLSEQQRRDIDRILDGKD